MGWIPFIKSIFTPQILEKDNIKIINSFLVLFEFSILLAYFTKVRFMSPVLKRDKMISGIVQILLFILPFIFLIIIGIPEKIGIFQIDAIQLYQFDHFKFTNIVFNCILYCLILYSMVPYYICIIQRSNKTILILITLLLIKIIFKIIEANPILYEFLFDSTYLFYYLLFSLDVIFNILLGCFLCKKRKFVERRIKN